MPLVSFTLKHGCLGRGVEIVIFGAITWDGEEWISMGSVVSEKPEAHFEVAMRMQGVTSGALNGERFDPRYVRLLGGRPLLERGREAST